MIGWWTIAKYGVIVAAIAGAVWWFASGEKAKGYSKGYAEGQIAASTAVNRLRDAQQDGLVSDIKAEHAKKLEQLQREYRELEKIYVAKDLATQLLATARMEAIALQRDDLVDQLRHAKTGREVRPGGGVCRVPQVSGSDAAGAIPARILSGRDQADLARQSGDAERANALFAECRSLLQNRQGK